MTAFLQCIDTRFGLGNLLRRETHITKNRNRIGTFFNGTFGLSLSKTLGVAFRSVMFFTSALKSSSTKLINFTESSKRRNVSFCIIFSGTK